MVRIIKKSVSEWLVFDKPIGEPECRFFDDDYHIERNQSDEYTIWFGMNTNWKLKDNQWTKLENSEWLECDTPIYEIEYQKLKRGKKLERILK